MQKIINTEKIPIKMWLDEAEDGALQQARNLANLSFAFRHIALMPDCHQGYGMPIGGVLATKNVIIPNAVGVDIGCGMCATKTNIIVETITKEQLIKIMNGIRRVVPLGFEHHQHPQNKDLMPQDDNLDHLVIVNQEYSSALKQLGTLGGGNHFIELQKDGNNYLWIMIHSGSRNFGFKVATHYNRLAKKINAQEKSSVPIAFDLAYIDFDREEARRYFQEMNYCTAFAWANRKLIMENVQKVVVEEIKNVLFDDLINIAHNYAIEEKHFGTNVIVHRKGATSAKKGEIGIIPGSQGTKSYIVEGLGNPESFASCSHGAGRIMGRKKAIAELNLIEEQQKLEQLGILHALRHKDDLEEAPSAYKNIDEVIAFQKDLVRVLVELSPLAIVKG